MSIKSINDLRAEAILIQNASTPKENTALRVGSNFVNIVDSQSQYRIPKPQLLATGINTISMYVMPTAFDFSVNNPELFLFRHKPARKSKSKGRYYPSRWYHPATVDAQIKYPGWKFFNGKQMIPDGNFINTRVTEWALPNLKAYQKVNIPFNSYMFIAEYNKVTFGVNYDFNFMYGAYQLNTPNSVSSPGFKFRVSGFKQRNKYFVKTATYAFAIAIDNPYATKTNGLCPKIFGPLSDPIHVIWDIDNAFQKSKGVKYMKGVNQNFNRPVYKASFKNI